MNTQLTAALLFTCLTACALLTACAEPATPSPRGGLFQGCYPNDTCDPPYVCNDQGRCADADGNTDADADGNTDADADADGNADGECIPRTCDELDAQCGTLADGCGNELECWKCPELDINAQIQACNAGVCEYTCRPGTTPTADGCRDRQPIAAGLYHSCALDDAGRAFCWGDNRYGRLGDGSTTSSLTPVPVEGLASVTLVAITVGTDHSCALDDTGDVYCWGSNAFGQLGDGSTTDRLLPTPVTGLPDPVLTLSTGANGEHTCVVTSAGAALCWGSNEFGQLGTGTSGHRLAATPVDGAAFTSGVTAIAASSSHTCLAHNGPATRTFCFGSNASGKLGDHTTTTRDTPVETFHPLATTSLASGGTHTCGLQTSGELLCWGKNNHGQLGNASGLNYTYPPLDEPTLLDGVAQARTGTFHTCALMTSGALKCWGNNASGQISGPATHYTTPRNVTDLASDVASFDPGWFHTCSVTTDHVIHCWGDNRYGQLGDGSTANAPSPVTVPLP